MIIICKYLHGKEKSGTKEGFESSGVKFNES